MARDLEWIMAAYKQRRQERGVLYSRMEEVRDTYNGDVVVPLPELDSYEKVAVANLTAQGLDQTAMRISSTRPDVFYTPVKPGSQRSENLARTRKLATLGLWSMNKMDMKLRRRARWLVGYASAPVMLRPDPIRQIPLWHLRNPLTTYPAVQVDPDDMCPEDCIFVYKRTLSWLMSNYPYQTGLLYKGDHPQGDNRFEVLEYVDANETVLMVLGAPKGDTSDSIYTSDRPRGATVMELERFDNRTGICPVVVPGRITLDRPQGQFDGMLGMFQQQAMLMALDVIAVKKSIFPDEWLVHRQGETAQIISDANGLRGQVGEVKGGDIVPHPMTPGMQTGPMIDRLERNQRVTGGIPAEFGGESTSNVRTGKRGDSILSALIDYPIQEAQEVLAASMQEENKIAVAIMKTHWGRKQYSFYVPEKWSKGNDKAEAAIDYVPKRDFENDNNVVSFASAGSDANSLIIAMGQRVGIGTMSKRTAMTMDPLIEDAEKEHDWVIAEALEQAVLQSVQQAANAGSMSPVDVAKLSQYVKTNRMELEDAVQKIDEEVRTRQATSGEPGTPEAAPEPGSPEAQPGIGSPDAQAQAGAAVQPPGPSMQNLSYLLGDLSRGARTARQVA